MRRNDEIQETDLHTQKHIHTHMLHTHVNVRFITAVAVTVISFLYEPSLSDKKENLMSTFPLYASQ